MRQPPVPVTMGSPWFRSTETRSARYIEARFSAGDTLHAHVHDRPILAVMLSGSFDTAIAGKRHACYPGWAWTEPCEERHANYIGTRGARVVVVQPDPTMPDFEVLAPLLDACLHIRDPLVALDARRILAELDRGDTLSPLALDALMVGMVVRVARGGRHEDARRREPSWLRRIRDLLDEEFRNPPSLARLSAEAGVTATHLCHAFRAHTGTTIGRYIRAARAAWAAEQLRTTHQPLSAIAAAAGYSDQSHFIRECRRLIGVRPSEYRRRSQNAG